MPRRPLSSRPSPDTSMQLPDHLVNVTIEGDLKDNKSMCQAIVKATGHMLGEISQQIVEFDNERKAADSDSARRLMGSTELIAKRLATLEKEILEGQRHLEVIDSLTLITQLAKAGDVSPIMSELGDMLRTHGSKQEELLSGIQDSHTALHNKHAKLLSNHGKLEEMLTDLHDGHATLHDRHSELLVHHGQQRDILQGLQESQKVLHGRHDELLGAFESISMPDMGQLHERFSGVTDALSHHSTKVMSLDQRLQTLEKSEQEQHQVLEILLQRLPWDLDKQLKSMQADLKSLRGAVQQDLGSMVESIQNSLGGIQKETQQTRIDAAGNADVMEKEVRRVHQVVTDAAKQTAALVKQQSSDVLCALDQIEVGPDLEAITTGVVDKIKKVCLRTEPPPALECLPDLHERMCHVHDKISNSNVHYDHSEVLKAIGRIKASPEHDVIAEAVHDRITSANIKVDHSEVIKAVGKLDVERALQEHSREVDFKLKKHLGDVTKALSKVPDHETIVNGVHDRLQTATLKVDHSELKQLIRRIPTEHNHDAMASAVHSRLGTAIANAGNHSKILDAISGLKLDPDLTVVLEAIEAMEESVLTTLLDAIQNIDMQVSCRGALPSSMTPRVTESVRGAARVRSDYRERAGRRVASPGHELSRLGDSTESPPRSAREQSFPAAKNRMDRSASTPLRTVVVASPEQEAGGSDSVLLACMCGYSCGTRSALERHLHRVAGQRGHRALGP